MFSEMIFVKKYLHIGGKRRRKVQKTARKRMLKIQSSRMKCLAVHRMNCRWSIQRITEERMSDGSHMNPDLMRSSCLQLQADMRKVLTGK